MSLAHLALMTFFVHGEQVPENLLKGLSSEEFHERERSQEKLREWAGRNRGESIAAIHKLSKVSEDPEVRQRCSEILRDLSDRDYLANGQGYLGIEMIEEMADLPGDERMRACVRILRVVDKSPADLADIRRGDLITALDGKKWYDAGAIDDFMEKIADSKPLEKVVLSIRRGDEDTFDVEIRLGRRPVENLRGIGDDLELLDKMAKDNHFKKWLEEQKLQQ